MAEFEWDVGKASSNLDKHGVSFAEAITVFGDPLELTIQDPLHSDAEPRFVSVGLSEAGRFVAAGGVKMDDKSRKALLREVLVNLDQEWMEHKANLQRLLVLSGREPKKVTQPRERVGGCTARGDQNRPRISA